MTDRAWFSRLYTTSGQETERVNSFNPGAHPQGARVPQPSRGSLQCTSVVRVWRG